MKIMHLILTLSVLTACNTKQDAKESTRLSNQSKILIQDNKLDEALQIVEKSIQLDPTNYAAYNNRAYINTEKNKPSEQVLADYYKALSIKPDYAISLYSLDDFSCTLTSSTPLTDLSSNQRSSSSSSRTTPSAQRT